MTLGNASVSGAQPDGPVRVFVSCAPAEDPLAAQLSAALEARGWEVWRHLERSLSAAYRVATQQLLERSQVIVVLWSRDSVASAWVMDEADVGLRSGTTVAVELAGVRAPLGFGGAVRVAIADASPRLSDADLSDVAEGIIEVADSIGLLGPRRVWLDRSIAAALISGLVNIGLFALLRAAASTAGSPRLLLGSSGLLLCATLIVASIAGGYGGDGIAQRLGVLPRAYRRRLLARWLGEAVGAGLGAFIFYLVLIKIRGYALSDGWLDGLELMLGAGSALAGILLVPKFLLLLISRRLQRSLLARPR